MTAARGAKANESLREFALSLPGAFEAFPWGDRVIKVSGKVFVFMGSKIETTRVGLSVKLSFSRAEALEKPYVRPTGYNLGRSGWVSASFEPKDPVPIDLLRTWILESYRSIAPKKLVAELDARGSLPPPRPARMKKT